MVRVIESLRGAQVIARWLLGMPFFSLYLLAFARDKRQAHDLLQRSYARLLRSCGWSASVVAGTPPAPGSGVVLCYNETAFPDLFAFCTAFLPHIDRAASADLYGWIPFARAAMRRAGFEMVARGNRAATDKLMARMVEAVRAGDRLAWGGEGRLSRIDGVLRFKVGSSLIAIRAGRPLVPVAFYGGHRAMPLGSIRARPGRICIAFGDPIMTEGLTEDDARALADRAQAAVAALYERMRLECSR